MRQYIYQSIIHYTLNSPMQCLEVVNPLNFFLLYSQCQTQLTITLDRTSPHSVSRISPPAAEYYIIVAPQLIAPYLSMMFQPFQS